MPNQEHVMCNEKIYSIELDKREELNLHAPEEKTVCNNILASLQEAARDRLSLVFIHVHDFLKCVKGSRSMLKSA